MKRLFLFLLLSSLAFGDGDYYLATYSQALVASTDALTIQMPAGATKSVRGVVAWVRCSAACTFTVSQNGTPATTTTLATIAMNGSIGSQVKAYSASNVGSGTTQGTYYLESAGTYPIDLTKYLLVRGTNSNITISIATFTGTWVPTIQWGENP